MMLEWRKQNTTIKVLAISLALLVVVGLMFLISNLRAAGGLSISTAETAISKLSNAIYEENSYSLKVIANFNNLNDKFEQAKKEGTTYKTLDEMRDMLDLENMRADKTGVLRNVKFNIISRRMITPDHYTFTTEVTAINHKYLMNNFDAKVTAQKNANTDSFAMFNNLFVTLNTSLTKKHMLRDIVKNEPLEFITSTVDIDIVKNTSPFSMFTKWKVEMTPHLYSAIIGYNERDDYDNSNSYLCGYINSSGEVIIDFQYNYASEFDKYGYAVVAKDGKFGIINKANYVIRDFVYVDAKRFGKTLILTKEDNTSEMFYEDVEAGLIQNEEGVEVPKPSQEPSPTPSSMDITTMTDQEIVDYLAPQGINVTPEIIQQMRDQDAALKSSEVQQKVKEVDEALAAMPTPVPSPSPIPYGGKLFVKVKNFVTKLPQLALREVKIAEVSPPNYSIFSKFVWVYIIALSIALLVAIIIRIIVKKREKES
ncbi:MAG: WG repeat-containing protein [Clostridiales bacterium]|jgi:hypothetical protein|nr:WG repeat-containing protein [Clostridiales bacterium]